jgi:uncharacterized protein
MINALYCMLAAIFATLVASSCGTSPSDSEDTTRTYSSRDYKGDVQHNSARSAHWLQRTAARGNSKAQFYLGTMYAQSNGVPQDYAKAAYWYRQAAEQGYVPAQVNLGYMYMNGQGVPRDYVQAHTWSHLAAARGNKMAASNRAIAARNMTAAQITLAQRLARQWKPGEPIAYLHRRPGSSLQLVKEVEMLLAYIGYKPGDIDGILDSKTRTAVREYQARNKQPTTDDVTKALRNDLRRSKAYIESYVDAIEAAHPNGWKIVYSEKFKRWINQHSERDAKTLRQVLLSSSLEDVITMLDLYKAGMANRLELDSTGSGFVVSNQGYVITNAHIVSDCRQLRVLHGEEETPAELIDSDKPDELAILQTAAAQSIPASFTTNRQTRLGEPVIVAGYPLWGRGLLADDLSVTTGSVSALAGLRNNPEQLQISAPIQPGNSGGPVLDDAGNVMGVVVSMLNEHYIATISGSPAQNINFAIKGVVAEALLDINGISYRTASSERPLETADVAEHARQFTVVVECWN